MNILTILKSGVTQTVAKICNHAMIDTSFKEGGADMPGLTEGITLLVVGLAAGSIALTWLMQKLIPDGSRMA